MTAPAPRGTLTAGPPPFALLFPSRPRRRPRPFKCAPSSTPSSPTPLWPHRAPSPSPLLPRPDRRLRPPEASPSCRISPSATAVFPLSGEHPPSCTIPKLELTQLPPLTPMLQDQTPTVATHRSSLPTGECHCPELFFRLPAALPFGYAPHPPALPGVTSEPHWCSRGAPRHQLPTVGPWVDLPPRHPARGDRDVVARAQTTNAAGPGRQGTAPPACRPTARDRPPTPAGCNLGPVSSPVLSPGILSFFQLF
jgi:hypothetical protein